MMKYNKKSLTAMLIIFNFMAYGLTSLYSNFMPVYFHSVFSDIQVGYLMAIVPVMTCIFPTLWGIVADHSKSKNLFFAIILAFAAVLFVAVKFTGANYILTMTVFALFAILYCTFNGMIDTISIENCEKYSSGYGIVRAMGTLGFGLISVAVTFLPQKESTFFLYIVVTVLSILSLMLMPKVEGHAGNGKSVKIKKLLSDKNFLLIMIVNILLFFAYTFYTNFMAEYLTEDLGLSENLWFITACITCLLEIPLFLFYDKLFAKLSLKTILIAIVVVSVIRYLLFSQIDKEWEILLNCLLTGFWITFATYSGTYYITKTVEPESIASAQQIQYVFGYGIPKTVSAIAGGYIAQYAGIKTGFVIMTVICAIAIIPAILLPNKMKYRDDN